MAGKERKRKKGKVDIIFFVEYSLNCTSAVKKRPSLNDNFWHVLKLPTLCFNVLKFHSWTLASLITACLRYSHSNSTPCQYAWLPNRRWLKSLFTCCGRSGWSAWFLSYVIWFCTFYGVNQQEKSSFSVSHLLCVYDPFFVYHFAFQINQSLKRNNLRSEITFLTDS